MTTLVDVDGRLLPGEEARVSVYDQGFLFGASVYETIRTYRGRPFLLDEHLERLARSARGIHLEPDSFLPALPPRLERALAASGPGERRVRLVVTRGPGELGYSPEPSDRPTVVVYVEPLAAPGPGDEERGVSMIVARVRRNSAMALDPSIKSSNLLNNFLAQAEARAEGAHEALMLNERDEVAEAASANVFVVAGGRIRTPPLSAGLLDGITRRFVLDLCARQSLSVAEETILPAALSSAEEIFLTSTTREILPVTRCDGAPVGAGRPGPVTLRLRAAFRAAVEALVGREG